MLQIHWFSIFNSFMMVIFLTGLVSMILLRTLRNDYAKCAAQTRRLALVPPAAAQSDWPGHTQVASVLLELCWTMISSQLFCWMCREGRLCLTITSECCIGCLQHI